MVYNDTVENDIPLDEFEKDFYQTGDETLPPNGEGDEESEEVVEEESEDNEEVNDLETEEEASEEEGDEPEEEEEPKPKKKHSAKDRIDELTAEKYEERRARQAAEQRAAELEQRIAKLEAGGEKEEPALREKLPANAPNPDATDKDGNPIYELGEFDPKYIRDLTKFTIDEETKAAREKAAEEHFQRELKAAQDQLTEQYSAKLDAYEEEVPEVRKDIENLVNVFDKIPQDYGEYLAMTIMGTENAPAIMHYFSQNIGEAQKIVAAGPSAATLAIGRLDAKMSKQTSSEQGEQKSDKKVSQASTPPEQRARGTHGRTTIRPDTDNLDAFEKIFYPKK